MPAAPSWWWTTRSPCTCSGRWNWGRRGPGSVTKFLNGHADVVGGIIVTRTEEMYRRIRLLMVNIGCNMDPHQAYLVLRGLKTLSLRVDRAQTNAMQVARWLERHPKVAWVKYIGLESHPSTSW